MALPEDGRHALITFQRFGFGARASDAAAISRDPVGALREDVARNLMELYAVSGKIAQAAQVFQLLSHVLQERLHIQPSAPTRRVYEAIIAKH